MYLELKNIHKSFGSTPVLGGIDLDVNQGDVLLPLSTLKRTDAQSVLLNWTQSKVKQKYKRVSAEGGQATNNLPTFFHYLFVLANLRLTLVFHVKHSY